MTDGSSRPHQSDEVIPAEIDGAEMAETLDGIPGAIERIGLARDEIARGERIPLDEL